MINLIKFFSPVIIIFFIFPAVLLAQPLDSTNPATSFPPAQAPVVYSNNASFFCSLGTNPQFQNLLGYATCIITKSVIPLIFVLAVAAFVWGVVQFMILGAGEEKKREEGKQFMIWGILALTVMIGVWGLVQIVANTFDIDNVIPQVKGR